MSSNVRYVQIAEDLRRRLDAGEWRPGERLPTLTALAPQYQADRNTVHRAITLLENEGYLRVTQGSGAYVRDRNTPKPARKRASKAGRARKALPPGQDPPIVFVAQLGTGGDSWKPVLDRLPGRAAFTYDRPGTGDAPTRPAPNPPLPYSAFAQELADLLDAQGIGGPAVFVGHSLGSLIVRGYAALRPERVAGLIHVDGSIPQFHLCPSSEPKLDGDGTEATEIDVVAGQVEILTAPTPWVPTVVLTRTPGRWDGQTPPPHPAVEDLWLVSQRILAQQANAPLVIADNSSHQIPNEAPGLVAYTVEAVIRAVRANASVELEVDRLAACGGRLDG